MNRASGRSFAAIGMVMLASCSTTNPRYTSATQQPGRDGIDAVMRASRDSFRACYERLLAKEPKATGKIVADFKIDPRGKPFDVLLSSDVFRDPEFSKCMTDVIQRLTFVPDGKVQTVKYPFIFQDNR